MAAGPHCTAFAEPVPTDQVALAGPDGKRAAELLGDAKRNGMLTLYYLALRAAKRLAEKKRPTSATQFFDESELKALADSLAKTTATANLLGRSRIRERADQAELVYQGLREFGENDSFLMFVEPPQPIPPKAAMDYFQSLVPTLNVPTGFPALMADKAFTMAVATDEALLSSVKSIIGDTLRTGDTTGRVADIQQLLERAGVAPKNPQYSEMVYRTNMMESYNQGAQDEYNDPLLQEFFPVWQYLGIRDGRQGADHNPHFDKYYPNDVPFSDVRGDRIFNCRCNPRPVSKYEWRDLQAQGATVETTW